MEPWHRRTAVGLAAAALLSLHSIAVAWDSHAYPAATLPVKQQNEEQSPPAEETGALNLADALVPKVFLPMIASDLCGSTGQTYQTISFIGNAYKDNRLTDENADFRLSILGYQTTNALLGMVTYGGSPDPDAPKLHGLFSPNRIPTITSVYRVYGWNWNESMPPPYGSRVAVNTQWLVTVMDVSTTANELINIPERNASIIYDYKAMVLYASEKEITLVYLLQDQVVVNGTGYVVHLMNLCVDPALVALYRAQLSTDGRRSTMQLPALRNNQPIGTAAGVTLTMAVRDGGAYMDPRSLNDWWTGVP